MSEKPDNKPLDQQPDPMMDTQWLLGMEPRPEGTFELEDILAEFGVASPEKPKGPPASQTPPVHTPPVQAAPPPPAPADTLAVSQADAEPDLPVPEVPPEPPPAPRRKWWSRKQKDVPAAPQTPETEEEEDAAGTPEEIPAAQSDEEAQLDAAFFSDMIAPGSAAPEAAQTSDETETQPEAQPEAPQEAETAAAPLPAPEEPLTESPTDAPSPPDSQADGTDPGLQPVPVEAIESIMANTVDAVKEEQEQRQERLRKRLEKARKAVSHSLKGRDSAAKHPLPDIENEPNPAESAMWNKRRLNDVRKCLPFAVVVTALLWLPWALTQFGITVPFFSESADNAALCILIPQAVVTVICWPVFRAALESLREGAWSIYATASLCTVVTLLDEMTLLLLPKRADAAPLGGLAAVLLVFSLWGLAGIHRGWSESLRTAAMGEPSKLVDRCNEAIAKGTGHRKGFYTRIAMEDTPAQWQRLLLPVLAAASLVFAVLSSVGKEQPQNLLWCWSVVLCASSSLVFPLAYCVPFGRLAAKLTRSGAAVAGQYGAAILSSSRKIAVTDDDLFPQNTTVSFGNIKLYGEQRNQAVSYAATLAVQGGGILSRIFGDLCRAERINFQSMEHFHIHEDGGLSAMIHGETVLLGTPAFMRHKAVRLPSNMLAKTSACLAVDGELIAVFHIKYNANDTVEYALRTMRRNGMQITLASRDGNVTPKLLKERFGVSGNIVYPELGERLTLSDPERDAGGPNGLMYREGLLPFAALTVGSRRLCQTILVGDILAILSSIAGALLGFYLTFAGSFEVLTPPLMLTYVMLWVLPMLPLVWTVDKL